MSGAWLARSPRVESHRWCNGKRARFGRNHISSVMVIVLASIGTISVV
jgi:hypothetical protein